MPLISIVVPVCNVEPYLAECMDSICGQSLQDIEIICINDGSTDGCPAILDRYASEDSRIRVIHKENTGYGHSMNVGLEHATGKYLAIVESDDFIVPEMMQTLYEYAELNEVEIVKADFYRFVHQADGTIRKIYNSLAPAGYYRRVLCPLEEVDSFKFQINIWAGIYRMDFIKKNHICFNETQGASYQDNGFWFQTFALANRVCFLDKPLYMNRRDNPLSSVHNKEKVYAACYEFDFIRDWIINRVGYNKRLLYLCAEARMRAYFFTINRIADSFKPDFYKRFQTDFAKLIADGEMAVTVLGDHDRSRLEDILQDPMEAYEQEMQCWKQFMQPIEPYADILIYGAGVYAKKVYRRLCDLEQRNRIAYFVVTKKDKNPDVLFGVPVVEVMDLPDVFKEKAFVIPAASEKVHDEVVQMIREHGFQHYTTDRIFIEE